MGYPHTQGKNPETSYIKPFFFVAGTLVPLVRNPGFIHRLEWQREICLWLGVSLGGLGPESCRNDVGVMQKSKELSWGLQISIKTAAWLRCEPCLGPPNVRSLPVREHCSKHDILHDLCQTCVKHPTDTLIIPR